MFIFVNIKQEDTMEKKKRSNYFLDKKRNRFSKLRFKDNLLIAPPIYSGRELAQELHISTGKLSELENEPLKEYDATTKTHGSVPNCHASVLKAYHEKFGCSYEYLMGETNLQKTEYCELGKDSIWGLFDDTFFDNIKKLFTDKPKQRFNSDMLKAFMYHPDWLQYVMQTIFYHLYSIRNIESDSSLSFIDKDYQTAAIWYSLNTRMDQYFKHVLMPLLQQGFILRDEKLKREEAQRSKEAAMDREFFESQMANIDIEALDRAAGIYSTPTTVSVSNISVTPQKKDD